MAQYDKCSSNSGCACLHIAGATYMGICVEQSLRTCSELAPCNPRTNLCYEPYHKCVHHPRCSNQPVCYPTQSFNQQHCPPMIEMNTTTTTASTSTTSTHIQQLVIPNVSQNATWVQNAVTIGGGNGNGAASNQFDLPYGIFVDDDETLVVADVNNHRIMEWKKGDIHGQVVAGGNGQGNQSNQLNRPSDVLIDKETNSLIICDWWNLRVVRWSRVNDSREGEILLDNIVCFGLAMDNYGYLYVSDVLNNEVRRYGRGDTNGTVVAGGNDQGDALNQLSVPTYISVDRDQNVYVSDTWNHRVMKWNNGATEGIVVAGGIGQGDNLTQLQYPSGIVVDAEGTLYAAETGNDRIMRWPQETKQGTVVAGGNMQGEAANQLNYPFGLAFDRHGNLYVADRDNHRVQRFSIE